MKRIEIFRLTYKVTTSFMFQGSRTDDAEELYFDEREARSRADRLLTLGTTDIEIHGASILPLWVSLEDLHERAS